MRDFNKYQPIATKLCA